MGHNLIPNFIKFLDESHYEKDELGVPQRYCEKFGCYIGEEIDVFLRNGEKYSFMFNEHACKIYPMKLFYRKYGIKGGCVLLFEYRGNDSFWLYIFAKNSEIYPPKQHGVFEAPKLEGIVKFWKAVYNPCQCSAPIIIPRAFHKKYGGLLPSVGHFFLNSGQLFVAPFSNDHRVITSFADIMHSMNSSTFVPMVVTLLGDNLFKVSWFLPNCVEVSFDGLGNVPALITLTSFVVKMNKSSLLQYSFGVEYHLITKEWKHGNVIKLYSENRCWSIEIQKRKKKVFLHHGWVSFWKDVGLLCGDVCLFSVRVSMHEFNLTVLKKQSIQ